jgi:hypothetical protein
MSLQASRDAEPPLELTRQRGGRPMRCPRCGQAFETMRRWSLACPVCGHAWQERSRRNIVDVLLDYREHAVFGLMLLAAFAGFGIVLYIIGTVLLSLAMRGAVVMIAVIVGLMAAWFVIARFRLSSPELEDYRRIQREHGRQEDSTRSSDPR